MLLKKRREEKGEKGKERRLVQTRGKMRLGRKGSKGRGVNGKQSEERTGREVGHPV